MPDTTGQFATREAFRREVHRLGFPASSEEIDALWEMVNDLREQTESLRPFAGEASLLETLFGCGKRG